jgi:signal transduction histidine kinase
VLQQSTTSSAGQVRNGAQPAVRQFLIVATALGLWVAIVVLFATQFMLVGSLGWRDAFLHAGALWIVWFFFMPAVVWLSFRIPFERRRIFLSLGIHLVGCVLVMMLSQFLVRNVLPMPPPPAGESSTSRERTPQPPARDVRRPDGFLGLRAGLDILIYWSLVGACQAITNFRRSQERERRAAELEARLTRSKLQALRMQINPHFLFNTLNAISTLVYVNARAADEMIGDLSELLRNSLDSAEEQEIPLARELEFIRHYVGIEKRRFGERLQTEFKVPTELEQALVPALILQPLVENAIRHGIEPQRAPGWITIEARREGQRLWLEVRDNGRGLVAEGREKPKRQGIGLANTQARLQELYGAEHSFSFHQGPSQGCVVEISIPWRLAPIANSPASHTTAA